MQHHVPGLPQRSCVFSRMWLTCGKPNSNLVLVSKRVETRSGGGKGPSLNTQLEQEVFSEYLKCFSDVKILVMTRTHGSVKL